MPRQPKIKTAKPIKLSPRDAAALNCFHRVMDHLAKHLPAPTGTASEAGDHPMTAALGDAAKRCPAKGWHATVTGERETWLFLIDPRNALRKPQVQKWLAKKGGIRQRTFGSILCALDQLFASCRRAPATFRASYDTLLGDFAVALGLPRAAVIQLRNQTESRNTTTTHQRGQAIKLLSNDRDLADQGDIDRTNDRYAGVWLAMRLRTRDQKILRFPLWIESEPNSKDLPRVTLIASNSADDAFGVLIPASAYFNILIFRGRGANRGDSAVKSFAFYRDKTAGPANERVMSLTLGGIYMGPSHRRDALVARHAILKECRECRADSLERIRERLIEHDLLSMEIGPESTGYDDHRYLLSHEHYGRMRNGGSEMPLYLTYNDFEEALATRHGDG
jgi:hypothetical protein